MAGMKNKGTLYPLIGVDFGSHTIKAVAVSGKADNFQIVSLAEVPTPKNSIKDSKIVDIDKVVQSTRTLLKHVHAKSKYIATSVSGSSVISKIIQTDLGLSDADLGEEIRTESEQLFPFSLEEVSLDYEVLGTNLSDTTKQDVLVCGTRNELVECRVVIFDMLGMSTKVCDVASHAIARAVKAMYPTYRDKASSQVTAIVDIGANDMTFAVLYQGEIIHQRIQSFGCEVLNTMIANNSGEGAESVERSKIEGTLPDSSKAIVTTFSNDVVMHIKRNIQQFTSSSSHRQVNNIVLTGGAFLLKDVGENVKKSFNSYKVEIPDMFKSNPQFKTEFNQTGCKYMTALGLALRSFEPCPI